MAVFHGIIRSASLSMDTHLCVVLPYDFALPEQQTPCKTLYLLHGLSQGCDVWLRRSNVERYAREKGIALIMPEVQRSFYLDMHYGPRYHTYISQELPELCRRMFSVSGKREDTCIAGLSMGGYGALLCALSNPDRYAAAASFSGAVDLRDVASRYLNEKTNPEFQGVLGAELAVTAAADLFALAAKAARQRPCPRVLLTCGRQDDLLHMSTRLNKHLDMLPIESRLEVWDGVHDWDFWETSIRRALEFFYPKS